MMATLVFLGVTAMFGSIVYYVIHKLIQGVNLVHTVIISIIIYYEDLKISLLYIRDKILEEDEGIYAKLSTEYGIGIPN